MWRGKNKVQRTNRHHFLIVYEFKKVKYTDLLFAKPSDPENAEVDLEKQVVDRALGISKCVVADTSLNR